MKKREVKKKRVKLKKNILIISIILVFLIFNLYLFNKGFYEWDVSCFQNWGNSALFNGVSYLYEEGIAPYPPLYLHVLKFNSGLTYFLTGDITLLNKRYVFISKLIPTLCNLLVGLVLFFYLKKRDIKLAIIGMSLYLFNLALIYNTAYWGQVDSVAALFSFLSILFLINKKYPFSVFFITLSILTKFQTIVLVPVIGIVILLGSGYKGWIKSFLAGFFTFILFFLPFIFKRIFLDAFRMSFGVMDQFPFVTLNAFNFWHILSPVAPDWQMASRDTATLFGFSFKFWGLFLLAIYTLLVVYQLIKKRSTKNILLGAASMAFAFFMLPTQIHERYLFPFFALMLLVVVIERKFLWVYITMSITYLLNLMMILGFSGGNLIFFTIQSFLNFLVIIFTFGFLSLIIALINCFVFIYFSKEGIFKGLYLNLKKDWVNFKKWLKK